MAKLRFNQQLWRRSGALRQDTEDASNQPASNSAELI